MSNPVYDFADNLGFTLRYDDLDALDREEKQDLAQGMAEESSMHSDTTKFYNWLAGYEQDSYWHSEFTKTAESVLLSQYHPNSSESISEAIHDYIRDTGERWRMAPEQGQFKLTLFDPNNCKALQMPTQDDVYERARARAVLEHNTEVIEDDFDQEKVRVPKLITDGVIDHGGKKLPYDITRYESCLEFDEIEGHFDEEKTRDLFLRARHVAEEMEGLIESGEVLYISENEFWKQEGPDNMAYHPETDTIVIWDRGEYVDPINSFNKEEFIERHGLDQKAEEILEEN